MGSGSDEWPNGEGGRLSPSEDFSGLAFITSEYRLNDMSEISIHIGWEYFLGLIGTLIGIAYYTNGRLTRLETTVEWVKDTLARLTARLGTPSDDQATPTAPKPRRKGSRRIAVGSEN
jgi:hypothetical protein